MKRQIVILARDTPVGDIILDRSVMSNAIRAGRKEMDCSHGEFTDNSLNYEIQFGSEGLDYRLK